MVKVFPMQVMLKLMHAYDLIMLFCPGLDQFWMTFDAFGTQKTGFRRRPRIDTPLSILGKVPAVGFEPATSALTTF